MLDTDQIQVRKALRNELNRIIESTQQQLLARHGFTGYREGEWLNPATRRHVRMGFASDEWTITVSDFPKEGYNGVAQLRMEPHAVIKLDARNYTRGQTLPTAEELVTLVTQ